MGVSKTTSSYLDAVLEAGSRTRLPRQMSVRNTTGTGLISDRPRGMTSSGSGVDRAGVVWPTCQPLDRVPRPRHSLESGRDVERPGAAAPGGLESVGSGIL
jgi:hypothetical protein